MLTGIINIPRKENIRNTAVLIICERACRKNFNK